MSIVLGGGTPVSGATASVRPGDVAAPGNHRVRLSGDTATVTVKGYAFNALDAGLGGGVWEVWGAYRVGAYRSPAGWRCTAFAFDAWRTAGDDAVRTHVLV